MAARAGTTCRQGSVGRRQRGGDFVVNRQAKKRTWGVVMGQNIANLQSAPYLPIKCNGAKATLGGRCTYVSCSLQNLGNHPLNGSLPWMKTSSVLGGLLERLTCVDKGYEVGIERR